MIKKTVGYVGFSNEALLQETKNLVARERLATTQLIECLEEVEARMLYAEMGYSSLWSFCTEYLKLSEGSAQRRISAMRLSRQISSTKEAIASGSLSLSNAAKLETFFGQERKAGRSKTLQEKQVILKQVEGLSQTECQKKLFALSPAFELSQKEVIKSVAEDKSMLTVVLDSQTVKALYALKDKLAHQLPNATFAELIAYLAAEKLKEVKEKRERLSLKASKLTAAAAEVDSAATPVRQADPQLIGKTGIARKAPSVRMVRALWQRAAGKCEYVSSDGKRCGSSHALEVDHRKSVALGGGNEWTNLRLLCRVHNGFAAQQEFGSEWMSHYLPRLSRKPGS